LIFSSKSIFLVKPAIQSDINSPNQPINILSLPILDNEVSVHYEGSIDKNGLNADWDWSLYKDENGEWVIFDVSGAGCIDNFVQHRYISSEEPIFRFYFDGEKIPRFTVKPSEFGEKYPFLEPLASKYIGPIDNGRGPIRVVRSFIPMYFKNGCRITSNIKLEGFDKRMGEGGWGHVVYHKYTTPTGIKTFTGQENLDSVIQMWKNVGTNPVSDGSIFYSSLCDYVLFPFQSEQIFHIEKQQGYISAIRIFVKEINTVSLSNLWIRIIWDNHLEPDIYCPIGSFFGNSLGFNNTNYLLVGINKNGMLYNYFPMPFWKDASISIENKGNFPIKINYAEVQYNRYVYDKNNSGYFRNSKYFTQENTLTQDSKIAEIKGSGKMVAAHVTCYAERQNLISCEGDVRVYIDGNRTPQVESDGSESYVCFGWGFATPPETHPMGGYDGLKDNPWSMTRLCISDFYPFHKDLKFFIESGEHNNQYLEHAGCVFYYGKEEQSIFLTDSIDLSDENSLKNHAYRPIGEVYKEKLSSCFEGNNDNFIVDGIVYHFTKESSFTLKIFPQNKGIKIRRQSDQLRGRQCSRVFVDNVEVSESLWYFADSNPYKRWLDDEFEIPSKYTFGKSKIRIRIEPLLLDNLNSKTWNESYYKAFCYK
jgi:hypothetical protein